MRILGLDVGDKNIGVAVSDKDEKISAPLEVIKNDGAVAKKLKKVIDEYKIGKIVVGVPYTLRGEVGSQAEKVFDFVEGVVKKLGVEVDYFDERYTTKVLIVNSGKKSKSGRIKEIDKFSAGLILDGYLKKNIRQQEGNE